MIRAFPRIAEMESGIFKDRIIILCSGLGRSGQKYSWIVVWLPSSLRFAIIFSLELASDRNYCFFSLLSAFALIVQVFFYKLVLLVLLYFLVIRKCNSLVHEIAMMKGLFRVFLIDHKLFVILEKVFCHI